MLAGGRGAHKVLRSRRQVVGRTAWHQRKVLEEIRCSYTESTEGAGTAAPSIPKVHGTRRYSHFKIPRYKVHTSWAYPELSARCSPSPCGLWILIDLPEAGRPGGPPPTQRHAPLLPTVWWQQWSRKDGSARRARARANGGYAGQAAHHWKHHEASVLSAPEIAVEDKAEDEKCTCKGCWHAHVRGSWQHTFSTR